MSGVFLGQNLLIKKISKLAVFWVFLLFFFLSFSPTFAATYYWNQSDWSGGEDQSTSATHESNQSSWTKYFSKDTSLKTDEAGSISLSSTTGSLTHNSSIGFTDGTLTNIEFNGSNLQLSMSDTNRQISAGSGHTCALKNNGTMWCWGNGYYGQLGNGANSNYSVPVQTKGLNGSGYISDVSYIASGAFHTCAVKSDGTVWCWGYNIYGRLGNNSETNSSTPVQVLGVGASSILTNVSKISAGGSHTCALKTDGTVWCWGLNNYGQLGINSTESFKTPKQVIGSGGTGVLTNISQISSGDSHTCVLKNDNTALCWGSNDSGRLGNNSTTNSLFPVQVLNSNNSGALTDISQISAGYSHTCALKTDGTNWCWGNNGSGQIGDNSTSPSNLPKQVVGVGGSGTLTGGSRISCGNNSTCSVKANGLIFCWGNDNYGKIGNTTYSNTLYPVQVLGIGGSGYLESVAQSTNSENHSCVIKTDSTVLCFGLGNDGRLGNNTNTTSPSPVYVVDSTGTGTLILSGYYTSGTFLSPIINLGKSVNISSLTLTKSLPSNTAVKIQLKSADTEADLSYASWSGPTGSDSYYTADTTSPESISLKPFVQYQATLETTNTNATPQFSSFGLNYQSFSPSGVLVSSPFDSQVDEDLISSISWMKSTPTDTYIKFQIRSSADLVSLSSHNWLGPDGTSSTYFTNNLGENTSASFRDTLSDRWLQYKVFLSTNDTSVTPTLYDSTVTYVVNAPPQFDSTYQTNGFGVTRTSTPGTLNFLYKIRDIDTSEASINNQYQLWPTFQYTLDNGATWTTIPPEELTGYTTDNPLPLTDNSTYTEAASVWDASSILPNIYNTMKIRIVIDDHEAANNTVTVTSDSFIFDTKKPTIGTVEGGGSGININHNQTTSLTIDKTNNPNATLYFSATDDSDLKIRYGLTPSLTSVNYQDYTSSVGFTLPGSDGSKTVYVQFKDIYNNESSIYSDVIQFDTTAPTSPSPLFSKDVSNTNTSEYRIFLNWPKNTDTDWVNYKIYQLNDQSYDLVETISSINTNYFIKNSLSNYSSTYIFKITSLDDLNNESIGDTISQEIGVLPSDTTPPTITNIQTSNKMTSSITISWTTDETATTTVLSSEDGVSFENTKGVDGYNLEHSVVLSGLSSNTEYFYKIRSIDATGNIAETEADSFTTNEADTSGPIISNIGSTSTSSTTATVTFATSESATSFVEYSTESGFSQGDIFGQSDLSSNHSIILRSLSPSTTYFYKIRSSDSLKNETISNEQLFTTLADNSDVTGPVISNTQVVSVQHNQATIEFTTNETSSSFINYGTTDQYGEVYGNNIDGTDHSIVLPANLSPQTVYYFRIKVRDLVGNETVGVGNTFVTPSNPTDSTPPIISNIEISSPTQNTVTVTWSTDESSTSYLGFSQDLTYSQEQGNSIMTQNHSVSLIGLTSGTTYYLRIKSSDSSGNTTYDNNSSQGYTVTTVSTNQPPTISSIIVENIATNSAKVKWETDSASNSYVEYWLNGSLDTAWFGKDNSVNSHEVIINSLLSQTTYYFRVRSKDSNNLESISNNQALITLSSTTTPDNITDPTSTDPSEETILDKIKNGTSDLIKKVLDLIPGSSLSEEDFVDKMSTLSPKIVSSPSISSSNIIVDPGVDKIIISWTTDKKSNSVVLYTPDSGFNSSNPVYSSEVGKYDESSTSHSVELINLNPNTTYHYKVRSKSEYGNWTDSTDFTFTTLSVNSEIKDFRYTQVTQKSVTANWSTTFDSRAMMEITDVLTGKSIVKSEEKGFTRDHSFTTDQLQTSTNYQLQIITVAKDGTVSQASLFPFSTSTSSQPPVISNVRISNALISGAVEQVQTIISWKTDKPSTSRILYNEGTSNELSQSTSLDKSLVVDHVVVTTNLKPGKVYKFKVESIDSSNNASLSKDYLIMTPKTQESVINLIIDNFLESFSFVTKGKK